MSEQRIREIEDDPVRVDVNERGTPFLVFPDGDDHGNVGEGRREATVAEWHFWRQREELLALLRVREQETAELLTLIQKYQPPGSPPPGDALILTGWVLRWWKEQAEGWTRHAQTSDREITELRQAVDDESRKINEQIALRISAIQERDAALRDADELREALRRCGLAAEEATCIESGNCESEWHYWRCPKSAAEPAAEETR